MLVELQGALTCRSSRITVWADSGPFLGLLLYFGVSESFPRLTNPEVRLRVGHQHSHIRPILVRFMHYYSAFWGPRAIFMIDDPRVRLCVRRQHSRFWPILTCFVDYYSQFCGPEAISIVGEPQGVLMCWSSTLAVLADSGPFHGLLLTVLGSQSDFHGCRPPRCAHVLVINNHSLGRFLPVSWTITLFWGLGVISTIDEPQGAFTCRSSTLTYSAESCPFRALLLSVLGTQSDFHD